MEMSVDARGWKKLGVTAESWRSGAEVARWYHLNAFAPGEE
jgi:hypothetical protein